MDCSPPASSVRVVLQARILGWVAISFSKWMNTDAIKIKFLIIPSSWQRYQGFLHGSVSKESTCNAGDLGLIPGWGRSPGEGKGYPPQYSCLVNSMDCIVHGVTKSQTWLNDFHSLSHGQEALNTIRWLMANLLFPRRKQKEKDMRTIETRYLWGWINSHM